MTSKKRILHVLYSGLGGHGNVFFSLVDADKENEFEYSAVFMGIEPVKEEYIQKCIEKNIPFHGVQKKIGLDLKAFYKVYKYIKKEKPDIVFLHTPLNILPAFFYKMGNLFHSKIFVRETQPNHLKTFQEWVWLYVAFFLSNKILFLSEQFKEDVKNRLGIFFRKKKSKVIPNGIDLNTFKHGPQTDFNSETVLLGMQGRLYKTKDHLTLIKAFAKLKDKPYFHKLQLHIAGDGTMRNELELLVKEVEVTEKVKFLGMLKEKELLIFLQSLGIYIHASGGETMSTAIMQVMACRLPIIASDVKGINNMVIHHQNGLLVPVHDAEAMLSAIDTMYNDEALRMRLAENGFRFAVDNFSNEKMWASYRNEFNNC